MGLNIRLHDITAPNPFTLSYKTGSTPVDVSTGFTSYGTTYSASTVTDYHANPIVIPNVEFSTQYWFKFTDTVLGNYTIENIYTHDSKYYECYDSINFGYVITGNTYDPPPPFTGAGLDFAVTVTIFDQTLPYGNHSSVIASNPHSYRIYTGSTLYITGATLVATTTGTTATVISGTTPTIISGTTVYPPIQGTTQYVIHRFNLTQPSEFYVFVEHGDGSISKGNNSNPKRQGGFDVKKIKIDNTYTG